VHDPRLQPFLGSHPGASLALVHSVAARPARRSLRTFGNGGAFSFTGFYYNKRLRSYRAYVTDPRRSVVLRYTNRRVVLSPAAPEDFVQDLALSNSSIN
jgi:hypothetical protein